MPSPKRPLVAWLASRCNEREFTLKSESPLLFSHYLTNFFFFCCYALSLAMAGMSQIGSKITSSSSVKLGNCF